MKLRTRLPLAVGVLRPVSRYSILKVLTGEWRKSHDQDLMK